MRLLDDAQILHRAFKAAGLRNVNRQNTPRNAQAQEDLRRVLCKAARTTAARTSSAAGTSRTRVGVVVVCLNRSSLAGGIPPPHPDVRRARRDVMLRGRLPRIIGGRSAIFG